MDDDLEKCVICLSWRKCAHTRQHPCKATPKQLCGPWAICVKCIDIVAPVPGQFGCPICKSELGPRRRAFEEGMEVAEWEVEPDTPEGAWRMPVASETQVAMQERNLPELRRLLDVKLPAEISAPVRAFMDARPELAAPPTPSTQRQRWAAVLSRLGIAAGQQKATQCAGETSQVHPGASSSSAGSQSAAGSVSAPLASRSAAGHHADVGGSLSDHIFGSSPPGTEAVAEKEAIEKAKFERAVAAAMAEKLAVARARAAAEKEKAATEKRRADRAAAEKLAAEKAASEKRRVERAIAEKAAEQIAAEKAAARRAEAEKAAAEKMRTERAIAEKAAEKAAVEKAAARREEAEKAATQKRREERAIADKAAEKAAVDKAAARMEEAEKAATEKRRAERAIADKAVEKAAVDKAAARREEAEKAASEKRRVERAIADQAAAGKAAAAQAEAERSATDKRRAERLVAEIAASEKAASEKEIADRMAAAADKMAAAAEKMAAVEKAAAQRSELGNAASENACAETVAVREAVREHAAVERAVADQGHLRLESEHRRRKDVQEEARVQMEAEQRLRSVAHERLRLEPERQLREEEQERLRKDMEQVLKSAQQRKDERRLLEQKQQRQEDGRRGLAEELAREPLGRRRNLPPETPAQACRGLDDATLSRCPDNLLRSFFAEYVRDDSDCILIDEKSSRHCAPSSIGSGAAPTRRPDEDTQMAKASARLDAEIATIRHAETARRRSSSAAAAERARLQSEQNAGLRLEVERRREQERLEQLAKEKRSQWKAVQLQERQRREADAERHQLEAARRQEVEQRQREADRRRVKEEEARLKMKAELRQREEEKERILVAAELRRRKDEEAQFQMDMERQRRQNEQERLRLEQERHRQEKEKEQNLKEAQARERESEKLYWLDVARREMDQVRLREGNAQKQALELERQQLKDQERRVTEKRRLLDAQEQILQQKRRRLQKENDVKQLQRAREASPIRTVVEGARPVHTPVRAQRAPIAADASCSRRPDHVVHADLSAHKSPDLAAVDTAARASAHDQPEAEARQIMRARPIDDVKGRQPMQGHSAAASSKRRDVEGVLDEVKERRPLLAESGKRGHGSVPSLSPAMKDGALLARIQHRMHSATKENMGVNSCAQASSSSSRLISHPAMHDTKRPLQPCGQKRRRDVESSARKAARTESTQRMPPLEAVTVVEASKAPVVLKLADKKEVVPSTLSASEFPPRSKVASTMVATTAPAIEKRRQTQGAAPTMSSMLAAFDAIQKKPVARMDKFPRR